MKRDAAISSEIDPATISVITDISANVFAVFMLILIVLLAAPQSTPAPMLSPDTLDIHADLAAIDRAALTPEQLVGLLHARLDSVRRSRIDLYADRIVMIGADGAKQVIAAGDGGALRAGVAGLADGGTVGLYVFDHTAYRPVTAALGSRAFSEISVPRALRQRDPQSGADRWSDGFAALLPQPLDRAAFTAELLRLLAAGEGGGRRQAEGAGLAGMALPPPFAPAHAADLMTRLAALARWALLVAGIGVVAAIEWRGRQIGSPPPR